jgi:YbbR domain-containing protein
VRRLLGFLVRNWPLKLGAVLLASVLYSGLVLSQNVRTFNGPVQIEAIRQAPDVALLTELPAITQIRYRAPLDVIVSPATFNATVDLSRVQPRADGQPVAVPVAVVALDNQVQVIGHEPNVVQVHLDPVESRLVTVRPDTGTVPEGLTLGPAQIDPQNVTVRGPSTRVAAIARVVARVPVDASALNVDREVDLMAIDEQGNVVTNVDIEPPRARVRIPVARQLANRTLPVVPEFSGELPNGMRLAEVEVDPPAVTVIGDEGQLLLLDGAHTQPIDLSGRTRDFEIDVPLAIPEGVTVTGRTDVRVTVTIVEETATRAFEAGLSMAGARLGFDYDLGASHVVVTLGGPLSLLEALDPGRLTARVDVADLAEGRHTVPIIYVAPVGLQLLSASPASVLVIVTELLPDPTEAPAGPAGALRQLAPV